jgi:hypothetical protein
MAIHALQRGQISRPQQKLNSVLRVPAPVGGIDSRVSLTNPNPANSVYCFNLVPFEYGMAVRKGYREWQLDLDDGNFISVNTIIPFDGIPIDQTDDRLFAVTNEGIWDVTTQGAPPVLKLSFTDDGPASGFGTYAQYITEAEEELLFYADSKNGLFQYESATDTWAQATGITGPVITDIRFVVEHKQRLWFIEEDSTKGWYLEPRSISGVATSFGFGNKFKHGGNLAGLFNWSVDGGDGIDDFLVAVSRAGDVLPYQGSDPEGTDWSLKGTYFIGQIPPGAVFATETGGELFILSNYGLTSMNDLLQGVDSSLLRRAELQSSVSGKIAGFLRERLEAVGNQPGWQIKTVPSEGGLLINTPRVGSGPYIQFFYNVSADSWGLWRDVPIFCSDEWQNSVVFGSDNGNIYYMDVFVDNVLLTPPTDVPNGDPIEFSVLTSYLPIGEEGAHKRVHLIRPDFLARSPPTYSIIARYDYDLTEAILEVQPPLEADGIWDIGLWDIAIWGSDEGVAYNSVEGTWGVGRYMAIAMVGKSRDFTRFIGWDVIFDTGGYLI